MTDGKKMLVIKTMARALVEQHGDEAASFAERQAIAQSGGHAEGLWTEIATETRSLLVRTR